MDIHLLLQSLVETLGTGVFADADEFRATLDDFASETVLRPGDTNLLVDAVRLGGYDHLDRMLRAGADPAEAVAAAGDRLAHVRGSTDPAGARWACAVLGYATGAVPAAEVRRYAPAWEGGNRPPRSSGRSVSPEGATAVGPGSAPSTPQPGQDQRTTTTGSGRAEMPFPPTRPTVPQTSGAAPGLPSRADHGSGRPRRAYVIVVAAIVAAFGIALTLWILDSEPWSTGGETARSGEVTSPPSGEEENPPAPFESVTLYDMARHHFDVGDCKVPDSAAEAPVAWYLDPPELVKCIRPGYSGTFLCTNSWPELQEARTAFLARAVDEEQPVTGQPAGQDPFPYQVAFHHESGGATRVYWDSRVQLCAGELQVPSPDLADAVELWSQGKPS